MIYNTIIFLLTNRCNLNCAHCCVSCSPQNNAVLEDNLINKVMDDIAVNEKINRIGISGGEAFLYPEKVSRIIEASTKSKKSVYVYTNGFWCGSYEKTLHVLDRLKKKGLSTVLTSVDTFHQKYIPIGNVKNLLDACYALNIYVKVHVSDTYSNSSENDELIHLLGLSKLNASITSSPVFVSGNALKNIPKEDIISNQELSKLRCNYDGMCSIDWDGNVSCCCSIHSHGMVIGNIKNNSINKILNEVRKNKIFMCILKHGIPYLADIIRANKLMRIDDAYTNGCELCATIFENEKLISQLENIL